MIKICKLNSLCYFVVIAMSVLSFASCGDDDNNSNFKPTMPANGGDNVVAIRHLGGVTTTYDWNFWYSNNRLVSAKGVARDASDELDQKYTYESWLGYGPDYVNIKNSGKENIQVFLNSQGYIEKMEINERDLYEFYYRDGRLSEWTITEYSDHFGHGNVYVSNAVVEYQNGDLYKITMTEPNNIPVEYHFVASLHLNLNGLLPVAMSKQLGCLGMEHLYYAGLMGKPTEHLVESVTVTHPVELKEQDYSMTFSYHIQNKNTVLCNYTTPNGNTASVSYQY